MAGDLLGHVTDRAPVGRHVLGESCIFKRANGVAQMGGGVAVGGLAPSKQPATNL